MNDNKAAVVIGGDTSQAQREVDALSGKLGGLGDVAKSLGPAIAAGFSISAIVQFAGAAINAADEMGKLSQKLGISVEKLAGYQFAAEQSGLSVEGFGGAVKKLSVYMTEHEDKLRSAGIEAKNADEALVHLADLFQAMPDGAQKTALAMDLMGKSGADMIPLLNGGGQALQEMIEKGQKFNPMTADMAAQAAEFNDRMDDLHKSIGGTATVIANDLLKVLVPLAQDMAAASRDGTSMADTFGGVLTEALRTVVVLGGNVAFVFKGIGTEIGGLSAQLAALATGDFKAFSAIGEAMQEDAKKAREEFDAWEKRILEAGKGGVAAPAAAAPSERDRESAIARASRLAGGKESGQGGGKKAKGGKKEDKEAEWGKGEGFTNFGAEKLAFQLSEDDANWKRQIAEDEEKERQAAAEREKKQATDLYEFNRSLFDEETLRLSDGFLARHEQIQALRDQDLINEQTYQAAKEQATLDYLAKSGDQEAKTKLWLADFSKKTDKEKVQTGLSMAQQLTAGLAQHSRAAFNLNKAASITQTVINTYDSAVAAYKSMVGIPYVGPVLGAIAAANAISFGMAQVNQIKSAQFGGGGGGGGGSASLPPSTVGGISQVSQQARAPYDYVAPSAPAPAVQGKAAEVRYVNVTFLNEGMLSAQQVREELIPLINEAIGDGVELRVTTN